MRFPNSNSAQLNLKSIRFMSYWRPVIFLYILDMIPSGLAAGQTAQITTLPSQWCYPDNTAYRAPVNSEYTRLDDC